MRRFNLLALAPLIAASVALVPAIGGIENDGVRFTANAISLGGPTTRSGTAQLDIVIDRWSSEAERQRLLAALKKDDQDHLLETLQDLKPVVNHTAALHAGNRRNVRVEPVEGGRGAFGFIEHAQGPRSG